MSEHGVFHLKLPENRFWDKALYQTLKLAFPTAVGTPLQAPVVLPDGKQVNPPGGMWRIEVEVPPEGDVNYMVSRLVLDGITIAAPISKSLSFLFNYQVDLATNGVITVEYYTDKVSSVEKLLEIVNEKYPGAEVLPGGVGQYYNSQPSLWFVKIVVPRLVLRESAEFVTKLQEEGGYNIYFTDNIRPVRSEEIEHSTSQESREPGLDIKESDEASAIKSGNAIFWLVAAGILGLFLWKRG